MTGRQEASQTIDRMVYFTVTVAAAPGASMARKLEENAEEVKSFIFQQLAKEFNLSSYHLNRLTSTKTENSLIGNGRRNIIIHI